MYECLIVVFQDKMLICDSCDKGYHIDCHYPPNTERPNPGSFYYRFHKIYIQLDLNGIGGTAPYSHSSMFYSISEDDWVCQQCLTEQDEAMTTCQEPVEISKMEVDTGGKEEEEEEETSSQAAGMCSIDNCVSGHVIRSCDQVMTVM